MIVEGFLLSGVDKRLVIIGNFINSKYEKKVHDLVLEYNAEDKVIFTGGIYRLDLLNMLRQNCFAYIHGHSAGGTNPSLLEAMIMEDIVIAHDNEFNREVGGNSILYFKDSRDLAKKIANIYSRVEDYRPFKRMAAERVKVLYSWDKVTDRYDKLLRSL